MHAIFSQFGNAQLESLKSALVLLYVLATAAVLAGVFLEKDNFPEWLKDTGWKILVAALAIETLTGGFIFMVDAEIQGRLGSSITALAGVTEKARGIAKQALADAKDARNRLSGIAGQVTELSNRENTLSDAVKNTEGRDRSALAQIAPLAQREGSLNALNADISPVS